MLKQFKIPLLFVLFFALFTSTTYAQQLKDLQYFRAPGKAGLNVFEAPKTTDTEFEGLYVRTGGDFRIIFQGMTQDNDAGDLVELSNNFALPTANLNFDVQIEDGVRMHLRTYLSSRHHPEAWVKGGYFQIDKLDFIQEGLASELMEVVRLRFGMDEINYGDTHFRRSDNAASMYNPFVGNYIMDSFTTEPFGEVSVFTNGFIGVLGLSNGRLNQSPTSGDDGFAFFGKLGYDSQINEDLRVRLTGSFYNSTDKGTRDYLYNGDRAGAHYYNVLESTNDVRVSDFLPRFNPGYAYGTSFQINPFVKYQGLEFFGVFEVANGEEEIAPGTVREGSYTQLGAELLYRFGADEDFYVGGRFNTVTGEANDGAPTQDISRINIGGGWFLTDYVTAKIEYVSSTYDGDGWNGTKFQGAEFSGINIEAVIGF